jgi:signal transduction histidine kinase
MDRMTTSGNLSVLRRPLRVLRANWPALLLPVVAAGTLGLFGVSWPLLLVIAAALVTVLAPAESAKIAPFALIAYGAYGLFLLHSLLVWEKQPVLYGFVQASRGSYPTWHTSGPLGLVLTEAVAFMAAGVALLARPGAPGGGAVRRAVAQLRGTDGQPRTVPPLLLFPVLVLWEEFFFQQALLSWNGGIRLLAVLIVVLGVAAFSWLPRAAAVIAVAGTILFGLVGVLEGVNWFLRGGAELAGPVIPYVINFYGAVPIDGGITELFALVQGVALFGVGCALALRLRTWSADAELAEQARILAQRVDGLTRTRSDAAETAVAELRRIERDLHDGAQARMVAVGLSLRAAEQLMSADPEAALALVAEARETSSRAIEDLRDLVRGIYPPVLADRGLAAAVRNLALDAPLEADVRADLPGEPPMPVAAAVYFAVAEALTNAVQHAGARTTVVSLELADGMLRASVTDDGRGGADASRGTGLAGVQRRLATFDGTLKVSSPAGGPTIVAIEVPCALSSVKISSC